MCAGNLEWCSQGSKMLEFWIKLVVKLLGIVTS